MEQSSTNTLLQSTDRLAERRWRNTEQFSSATEAALVGNRCEGPEHAIVTWVEHIERLSSFRSAYKPEKQITDDAVETTP